MAPASQPAPKHDAAHCTARHKSLMIETAAPIRCFRRRCRAALFREDAMSQAEGKPVGPDFAAGIPVGDVVGEDMLLGHARGEPVILARRDDQLIRDRRDLHALRRRRSPRACSSATRCAARGTTPASACAPARRSAPRRRPDCLLARRAARRQRLSSAKSSSATSAPRTRHARRACRSLDRHRRRRCGGQRGRGNAAPRGLRRARSRC